MHERKSSICAPIPFISPILVSKCMHNTSNKQKNRIIFFVFNNMHNDDAQLFSLQNLLDAVQFVQGVNRSEMVNVSGEDFITDLT